MNNKTVLLIDGDRYLLRMYENMLSAIDFKVLLATDGDRGLFLAKEHKPNVVVLALNLERRDGLSVLKEIKKDKDIEKTPVIILSNSGEREDIRNCLNAGACSYLIKIHHTPSEVVEIITNACKY